MPTDPISSDSFGFSRRARAAADQPISYLMAEALARPQLISLAAGFVDDQTLPIDELTAVVRDILADPRRARAALQYGTTQGLPELRELLYQHMVSLEERLSPEPAVALPGSPDQVVVTTGSQQLLHILTDLLIDEGDIVITAWPTYFVYTGALTGMRAAVRAVDVDDAGMRVDKLDALLEAMHKVGQLQRVKIIYCCSYHQNPTGLTLAAERRRQLVRVAKKWSRHHRILIIEDAAYRELTYGGTPPPPSIKRYDDDNQHVALLQTCSKPFAPGLKTGYGLLPDDLVEPVCRAKGGRDFGSANFSQHLLLEALRRGAYAQHIERLRNSYALKRDAMLTALDEHLSNIDGVTWTRPTGGLYVWLTLPEAINTGRDGVLFQGALEQGVLFVPGEFCYPPDPVRTPPRHMIRLSFGVPTVKQIREGIARLSSAIRAATTPVTGTAAQTQLGGRP